MDTGLERHPDPARRALVRALTGAAIVSVPDGIHGHEQWISGGTKATTKLLKGIAR